MKQYMVALEGTTPMLHHQDNLIFGEKVKSWQKDPANKEHSISGDDRSPAWTWVGYLYHDRKHIGIPADNLMTMLREGGAKTPNKGKETYKRQAASGIIIDGEQWDMILNGNPVPVKDILALVGNNDFLAHAAAAEALGFELNIKRAKIGASKHVRVRPMFRGWSAVGSLTVIDEELSGLTKPVLQRILDQAGAVCGLADWRPSSPSKPGSFGKFAATIKEIK